MLLGILSNSSVAMALTMDAAKAMGQILKVSPIVYGISLEGLNGNVAPVPFSDNSLPSVPRTAGKG